MVASWDFILKIHLWTVTIIKRVLIINLTSKKHFSQKNVYPVLKKKNNFSNGRHLGFSRVSGKTYGKNVELQHDLEGYKYQLSCLHHQKNVSSEIYK